MALYLEWHPGLVKVTPTVKTIKENNPFFHSISNSFLDQLVQGILLIICLLKLVLFSDLVCATRLNLHCFKLDSDYTKKKRKQVKNRTSVQARVFTKMTFGVIIVKFSSTNILDSGLIPLA